MTARQMALVDTSEETEVAEAAVVAVRKILDDKTPPEDISLDQLLDSAKVPHDTYMRGLGICATAPQRAVRCVDQPLQH